MGSQEGEGVRNFSITLGDDATVLIGAHQWRNPDSWSLRPGGCPTAPPSAYAGGAATAFLAAISSAFRRISSANRGI
jgi:hypothetical protein